MPLRRIDRQTLDPPEEREIPGEWGRQVPNPAMERKMHNICARLVDTEIKKRRTTGVGHVSESKREDEVGHEGEDVVAEDAENELLIRVVARMKMSRKTRNSNML
jgi:hypothetical protein